MSRRIGSYDLKQPGKDGAVAVQLMEASNRYPRFGYRRIAVMTGQSIGVAVMESTGVEFAQAPPPEAPLRRRHTHSWRNLPK